ncbi:MAG: hypothetical protein J0M30_07940 [Chitinophagales bacterium]|nr:hypothetical protein [Chitinophagales bacterium]
MRKMICATGWMTGLAALLVLSSCAGGKKMRNLKETLMAKAAVDKETLGKLEDVRKVAVEKSARQQIDASSGQKIIVFVDSMDKEIRHHLSEDSILLNARIRHRDLPALTQKTMDLLAQARVNLENVTLINEILSTNTFVQFNTSSLFAPGQYHLADNLDNRSIFQPLVNELTNFAGKFSGKKLTASVIILGFADADPIAPESGLAQLLKQGSEKTDWTSADLNQELSRRRAESVGKMIKRMIADQTTGKPAYSQFSTEVLPQGRGEEYPDPAVTDYQANDERRRIVKVFWNILPF